MSDIEVTIRDGQVTLSGTVEDRRAKRLAEDIAEEVWGVAEVNNELKVSRGRQDWRDRAAQVAEREVGQMVEHDR